MMQWASGAQRSQKHAPESMVATGRSWDLNGGNGSTGIQLLAKPGSAHVRPVSERDYAYVFAEVSSVRLVRWGCLCLSRLSGRA